MFDRNSLHVNDFSWKKSLSLAIASQVAYHSTNKGIFHITTKTWGFDRCETFDIADTQGFVAWDSSCILISFRGTTNMADWLYNLNVFSKSRPYGTVHKGFWEAYDAIKERLSEILEMAGPSGKKIWLTGHSLGGAIASIAGTEFIDKISISGFYTYGQPKTGEDSLRQFFSANFPGMFYRFVNDDDIVPQVPPNFTHVGRLIWFSGNGNIQQFDSLAASESTWGVEINEIDKSHHEMDEAEFLEFKEELGRLFEANQSETEFLDESIEGFFPSISDHRIDKYIKRILRYAKTEPQIDDLIEQAALVDAAEDAGVESATRSSISTKSPIPILLRVKSSKWKAPQGLQVQSRLGSIITARSSIKQIESLKLDDQILSIDVSRDAGFPELDSSMAFVQANSIQRPPFEEKGDSAIIAVIDTGVDVLHEAFRDDAGNTRIIALWNQRGATENHSPNEIDPNLYSQDYGRLYTNVEIQAMIDGQVATPTALRDPFGHGTHVASIAAGQKAGNFAGGLAPEAKLIVIIPDMNTAPGDPHSLGYSNSHVDALAFIRTFAEAKGFPVAVNVSLGMNAGAHDGTSTLEVAFDAFSGFGRDRGLAIIKSAGNERGHKGHASADAIENGLSEIVWETDTSYRDVDYIEVWFQGLDEMEFTLKDPDGNSSDVVSNTNPEFNGSLGRNHAQLNLTRYHRDNGQNRLTISIMPDTAPIQNTPLEWTLQIHGIALPAGGEVHAWVERDRSRAVAFESGDNDEMTLSIPGTADTVITVAACWPDLPLRLTNSSSWGLTWDGRYKPDICAPGKDIVAARSNTDDHTEVTPKTGTSMAAPHVTGAVALLMSRLHKDQTRDQVNARQILSALRSSTQGSNRKHHKGSGYGPLDVEHFIRQFE